MAPTTGEQAFLSTEIVFNNNRSGAVDSSSTTPTFSVRVRRRLPDFLQSVNLKYVKLGYHYLISHGVYLAAIAPAAVLLAAALAGVLRHRRDEIWSRICDEARGDPVAAAAAALAAVALAVALYLTSRPLPIYLIDFACYRPPDELRVTREETIELARASGRFSEASIDFQRRILAGSGIGDETYLPRCIFNPPGAPFSTMKEGRAEASAAMFGALDELFAKTKVRPKDIGVLVVNCSLFNPTPSLSAMIVNHYKMRGDILSYNLGGMGCSAGVIAVDLAQDMLQGSGGGSLAVVVSTEAVSFTWYAGDDRSMLIPNAFFRSGCSAALLSSRRRDGILRRAKYRLEHVVRTHKGGDDRSFRCVYQREDENRVKGLAISRDLMEVGGHALKANITTLGPLVLPVSEQILFFAALLYRYLFRRRSSGAGAGDGDGGKNKPYIPDFKMAFEHFCVHAASKGVLDEMERNLGLREKDMEASRAALHRFGNTSSSSVWYELAYLEAKGKVRRGDRVWQLAFGSGFKCNSAVWRAVRSVRRPVAGNPWIDCADRYPSPAPAMAP